MRRFFWLAVVVAILNLVADIGLAQLVVVRPGYVKAPFVRVYSFPDGGSRVRAPFVDVYTPGYAMHHVDRTRPTPEDFRRMNWRTLNESIRELCPRLEADLKNERSGDFWRSSLKTAEIIASLPVDSDDPPPEEVRQQLRAIYDVFDSVSNSPGMNGVAGLTTFQMLHFALGEYTMAPEPRLRRQLTTAARQLNRALDQFKTGPGWQTYLLVTPGATLAPRQRDRAGEVPEIDAIREALTRFESVSQNPEYKPIAEEPEFQTTHQMLIAYWRQRAAPGQAEELPEPIAKPAS